MIRPYTSSDKPALIDLLKLNTPLYFAEEEENDFIEYLDQHLEDYFVVEQQGAIVGAGGLNYFPEEKLARISWDIIHPNHQGKGIGAALMRHRIDHLKSKAGMHLAVVRTTQLVYRFYEKMGFTLQQTEKDFWAPGFDLYQMHMPLQ